MTQEPSVCRHGSLRRSCEPCDLEAELVQLRAEHARVLAQVRGLRMGLNLSNWYHDTVAHEFDLPDPSTNAIVDRLRAEIASVASLTDAIRGLRRV